MGALTFGFILFIFNKLYSWFYNKPLNSYVGKRVIVTGASSGIGAQLALQYIQMKCKVAIVARRLEQLESVKQDILKKCPEVPEENILILRADLTVESDCRTMVDSVVSAWGGIDICVWNAGVGSLIEFEKLNGNFQVFRDNMNINFFSTVYCTSFALPFLRQSHGSLVVVSSLAGKFGTPLRTSYSASKHALHGFLNSLRNEVSDIQVTVVCPGFVQTEFHTKLATTDGKPIERESHSFMTAEECAEKIVQSERLGEREVLLGLKAKVGNYLMPFIPGVIDYMSRKASRDSIKKK
ncbi:hypothetical protein SAMD00019534_023290 [Acytostelium subglobosum LB1]|uniref:hypothetical protein n=1 Tax=Acytostelium subglobosum LB1 TaxID=1410327 RepID=UPI000644B37B|nr:hypothetical protein SAMD00019534_023290 [Acytostelium subglobosum LB1]GAM19154.1 hypothetical protein SAMD00019534_023290 [Acytostelium subglobosum LB1]|eukprot:XP_012757081.1 hypothetical protein SAMD00019534_023290 [Acytostelium subglobosum LB1]